MTNSEATGGVNLAAPGAVTNSEFFDVLARARGRGGPVVPVPAWPLRRGLGESASVVLDSQRVHPSRLLSAGFTFEFPELHQSLVDEECL